MIEMHDEKTRFPVSIFKNSIFSALQGALYPDQLDMLRHDLLEMARARQCPHAFLELSGVTSLGEDEYDFIVDTAKMMSLMGVKTFIVGMQPGVIAGLAQLGVDLSKIPGLNDLNRAYE